MSAKIGATFWPHERQAPIIRPETEGGDCEAGRLAEAKKFGSRRYVVIPAAEARSFCTEDPAGRVVPATGEYRVPAEGEGEGPRHLASAQKSQHNYPAKALRAVGRGVGQAEPLTRAFQLSPSTATETKKKRVRPPPLGARRVPVLSSLRLSGPRRGGPQAEVASARWQCPNRGTSPSAEAPVTPGPVQAPTASEQYRRAAAAGPGRRQTRVPLALRLSQLPQGRPCGVPALLLRRALGSIVPIPDCNATVGAGRWQHRHPATMKRHDAVRESTWPH
jgi:hypothetical protein